MDVLCILSLCSVSIVFNFDFKQILRVGLLFLLEIISAFSGEEFPP